LCTIVPEIIDNQASTADTMQTRFKIILPYDTINGRKKLSFKDDETMQQEKSLSQKMFEKRIPFDLDIMMAIVTKDKGKSIDFDMFDNNFANKKSALLNFGNYFSINITTALKYFLKKRWEELMKASLSA
jgi:hypothetical protein